MIGVSLGLGVVIASLMFMFAYAMQNPQMVALAREELAALVFTVFILFFWLSFDSALNGISSGLLSATLPPSLQGAVTSTPNAIGLTQSHITLALATLQIVEQRLKSQYIDLYLFEALIGFLSTISFPLGSPIPAVNVISFSLAPFTGLTLLSNAHTVVVESIGYLITVLWSKEFILIFARDAVPLIFLPLGLILRAIPFFRRTGSSVIALSFALYFVMPFAMILSNYLIFDLFRPADFTYTPAVASYFGTSRSQSDVTGAITEGREGDPAQHLFEQFQAPNVVSQSYSDPSSQCSGNAIVRLFCSARNVVAGAFNAITGFFSTVWTMWRFMVGMTGDFFWTILNNPAMPASASAGLFYFVVNEVGTISPFIILVMLSTVVEIILTVTTYRSISMLIGGEAEIIGLSKVV
ncbi:MAG: hypothetical protein U0R44_03680 [Candidatus Micrarchaeia archaeon]